MYAWIDPDLLDEKCKDCECGLCLGVMVKPVIGCDQGHSFCKFCYVQALARDKRCPTCRAKVLDENRLVPNRTAEHLIAKLRLQCEHAAACWWKGRVGGLAAHLRLCGWAPVQCPNEDCTESPLRKDLPKHDATCEHALVGCRHCSTQMARRSLAEHEGLCLHAKVECPNEGCSVQHARRSMNVHRDTCPHEEVSCPYPRCDARLPREDLDAHFEATHRSSAAELLMRIAALEGMVAAARSEQRHAAVSPTSWVFNWMAEGWQPGTFKSETHAFGGDVRGFCVLVGRHENTYIGFGTEGVGKCRVSATFSILDKHDKTLRQVHRLGTASAPVEIKSTDPNYSGTIFTPTAEEKAQSVRADGSIRVRAVVRICLDGAA
ncbi:hypothetical protein T484DRAFT_1807676 [Baffinella frigidus]|nr:hypothetical protein T484DRAFT_1807676 [Cryptophyta sp. CCMP2293]